VIEPTGYTATDFVVEPDASAATYLWAAEVLTKGAIDLGVAAADFTQPDAVPTMSSASSRICPPKSTVRRCRTRFRRIAVLAAFNETPVRFVGIANLRVKECDRIRASRPASTISAPIWRREEATTSSSPSDPALAGQRLPAEIDTFADHRIAMSFALAGLKIDGITILDPDCVGKTFPAYWRALAGSASPMRTRADII
jgi:3-phosphoshikimate 1-carboxyvinyltransferase